MTSNPKVNCRNQAFTLIDYQSAPWEGFECNDLLIFQSFKLNITHFKYAVSRTLTRIDGLSPACDFPRVAQIRFFN
jgi:hypothetical protein